MKSTLTSTSAFISFLLVLINSTDGFAPVRLHPTNGFPTVITTQETVTKLNLWDDSISTLLSMNTSTSTHALDNVFTISTTISSFLTNDNIKIAFNLATFGPQILWLLMILLPRAQFTQKIMGGYGSIIASSFIHLFIVVASASQDQGTAPIAEFSNVFDPSGNPQAAMVGMMKYPNFVSEEWSHVLTWDLFVGRWIWLDGVQRGIPTPHSVLLCNLIGPPGFLLHCLTCVFTGKGLPKVEMMEIERESNNNDD